MKELIRDTVFGHFLRIVSGGKMFPFEEDRNPSIWKRYIDKEKSGRMAHHGTTEEEQEEEKQEENDKEKDDAANDTEGNEEGDQTGDFYHQQRHRAAGQSQGEAQHRRQGGAERNNQSNSRGSSDTRVGSGDQRVNRASGVPIDPEKGMDASIVTWYSDKDPEVCKST